MNLENTSAVQLARKIAAMELSSRDVTAYFLERSQRLNDSLGAYIRIQDAQVVLSQASKIDEQFTRGLVTPAVARSPLAGVPIAIKDVLCLEGLPTSCGSRMLESYSPPYTATCVQRLIDAGLIPLGKTNMDEFAMGSSTENSAFGASRNPWDLERTPGGSSGGAGAVLAGGLAPLSIGSDTGGSVRQPAAFCGVCGLKPTYGLISRYGLVAFASSLDSVGPMAHHVEDIAGLLQILAGHDPRDSTSLNVEIPDYLSSLDQPLKNLRIGIVREHACHPSLDEEIASAVDRTRATFESLGGDVVDVSLPHSKYSVAVYYVIAPCEASSNLARYEAAHYGLRASSKGRTTVSGRSPLDEMMVRSRTEGLGEEVKRRIMLGSFALSAGYSDAYYKQALRVRRLIAYDYRAAFEKVDLLIGPAVPTTAFKLGEKLDDPIQMYLGDLFTVEANLVGIPALSIPCGFSRTGLPLAVQLQAPHLQEARLLAAAHQLQRAGLFTPRLAPDL